MKSIVKPTKSQQGTYVKPTKQAVNQPKSQKTTQSGSVSGTR